MTLGALGYVGYGIESVANTPVAPSAFLPVSTFSVEDVNDFLKPAQIRHSRDYQIAMVAPYNVSGSMEMELIPSDVGALLGSAFSAVPNSSPYGGGGYEHVYTPASDSPTLTFESSAGDILVMRYAGMQVNTLEVKAAFGEVVTATFGLEGIGREKQGSASTPSFTDTTPLHFTGTDVHVAGGTILTTVKDFTFGVNNNLTRIGTLRRTRNWKRMAFGMREVTLALSLDFTDTSEYDRFLTADTVGEAFDVDLYMEGQPYAGMGTQAPLLRLQPTNVLWNKSSVPLSAGEYLSHAVEALIIAPIGGSIMTASLVNAEATTGLGD